MGKVRGKTLRVVDSDALAAVASWVIENRGGSWLGAFKRLQISRSTLLRFKNKQLERIGEDTFENLRSAVWVLRSDAGGGGKDDAVRQRLEAQLVSSVLLPLGMELRTAYRAWRRERALRLLGRRSRHEATRKDIAEVTDADVGGRVERDLVLGRLTGLSGRRNEEFVELKMHIAALGYASDFVKFKEWAYGRGHDSERVDLAVRCVLEPLLESSESGFVERHWREMKPEEMRRFARAGLARERILLTRLPELPRIQTAVRNGPRSLYRR